RRPPRQLNEHGAADIVSPFRTIHVAKRDVRGHRWQRQTAQRPSHAPRDVLSGNRTVDGAGGPDAPWLVVPPRIIAPCFIMTSPIAFIISPRISSMCAIIFGSIFPSAPMPIIGPPIIVPPIIWRHMSIIGIMPSRGSPMAPADGVGVV